MKRKYLTAIVTLVTFLTSFIGGFNVNVYAYDDLGISYDCGDVTYFHSDYISDKTNEYENFEAVAASGNTITQHRVGTDNRNDASRTDNTIELQKTASGNCYFDVKGIQDDPRTRYLVQGKVKSTKLGAKLNLCTTRRMIGTTSYFDEILYVDASGNIKNIKGTKIGTLTAGEWTEFVVSVAPSAKKADIYINGVKAGDQVSLTNTTTEIDRIRFGIDSESSTSANLFFDELEVTGLVNSYNAADPVANFSSILYNDAPVKTYLTGKTVFYSKNNAVFYNGSKSHPEMTLVEGESDLYGDARAFKAGFGATVTISASGLAYNGSTYFADSVIEENGAYLAPIKAFATQVLNKQSFEDGNGIYMFSDSAINLDIASEVPEYKIPVQYNYNSSDIKAINWYMKYTRPNKSQIKSRFEEQNQAHPRILATKDDFDQIRAQNAVSNSFINSVCTYIIRKADEVLAKPVLEYEIADGQRIKAIADEMMDRIEYLAFAYQVTGNAKYVNCAWNNLEKVLSYPDWNPTHMLDVAELNYVFAIAYDWMYDGFSASQRQALYEGVRELGMDVMQRSYYGHVPNWSQKAGKINGFVKFKSNFNAVINGGALAAAMAFAENDEDFFFDIAEKAIRSLEYTMAGFEPDGSWLEGVGYWDYTMRFLQRGIGSMQTALDRDYGLMQSAGVHNSALWYRSLVSDQGRNNFYDASADSNPTYAVFQWLAKNYNDTDLAATRRKALEKSPRYSIGDAIWYMDGITAEEKDYPLVSYFRGTESVTSRSSFNDKNAMFFSSHAGVVKSYHSHADVGTFVFDALGERWACDLGNEDYNVQSGSDYYAAYRRRAEAHNVVVINPNTDAADGGQIDDAYVSVRDNQVTETESGAEFVYEMKPAYSTYVDNYRRKFTTDTAASTLIIKDYIDLKSNAAGADVCWFMTTAADVEWTDATHFVLSKNNKYLYGTIETSIDGFTAETTACTPLLGAPVLEGQSTNEGYSRIVIRNQNVETTDQFTIKVTLSPDREYGETSTVIEPRVSRKITFDNFNTNEEFTEDGIDVHFRRSNTSGTIPEGMFQFESSTDAAGNANSALRTYPKSGSPVDANDAEKGILTTIAEKSPIVANDGEYYEIAFDYGWKGGAASASKTEVRAYINGSTTNYMRFFTVGADGILNRCLGELVNDKAFYFNDGCVYNVRMIFLSNSEVTKHHYYLYINDVLISDADFQVEVYANKQWVKSSGRLSKFTKFEIYSYADYTVKTVGTYTSSNPPTMYLDNFSLNIYEQMPEIGFSQVSYGFDNLTTSTDKAAIAGEISSFTKSGDIFFNKLVLRTDEGHESAVVGGVMGKTADDKALRLYQASAPSDLSSILQVYMPGCVSDSYANRDHTPKLEQGEFEEIEAYLAWDGASNSITIQGFYSMNVNGDGKGDWNILTISRTGDVSVMGTHPSNIQLIPNCWYKFNIVFHSGSTEAATDAQKNWVKLYINDRLVQDKVVFTPNGRIDSTTRSEFETFQGFKKLWIVSQTASGATYPSSSTYIDDITIKQLKYEPRYSPVEVNYSTEYATVAMADLLYGYTGNQIAGATASVSGGTVQITNNSANVNAFTGNTDNFRIIKADGTKLYGVASAAEKVRVNINDFTVDNGDVTNGKIESKIAAKNAVATLESGIAGKADDDQSVIVRSNNITPEDGESHDPFFNIQKNSITDMCYFLPYTIEMTVRCDGNYETSNLQVVSYQNTSGVNQTKTLIHIEDGLIGGRAGTTTVPYHNGEWVKFAATIYPRTNKVESFVNGKSLGMYNLFDNPTGPSAISRYKLEVRRMGDGETESDFEFGFDNIKIYNGVYRGADDIELTDNSEEYFDIYNDGRVIFTNGYSYVDEFAENVTGYYDIPVLYTDASLAETTEDFAEGSVLAVRNEDGDMVKYYYISENAPSKMAITSIEKTDGNSFTAGNNDITVSTAVFAPMTAKTVKFILSEAADGKVLNVGMGTKQINVAELDTEDEYFYPVFVQSDAISVNITKPVGGSELRAFVWEMNDTPLAQKYTQSVR